MGCLGWMLGLGLCLALLVAQQSVLALIVFVALVAVDGVMRRMKPLRVPMCLSREGKYAQALAVSKELARKYQGQRQEPVLRYNVGVMLHRLGRFEESRATLESVDSRDLPGKVRGFYFLNAALNDLFMGQEGVIVARQLEAAEAELGELPYTLLPRAHFELRRGQAEEAERCVEDYLSRPPRRAWLPGFTIVYIDPSFKALEQCLLGYHYLHTGRPAQAREALALAAQFPPELYYARMAKDLLDKLERPEPPAEPK
ncbi:MAG: hypothetical protein M5U26_22680 [Planctomycetota bacterium]|nr:hypothetical protein [Planctomycetota bacterium]